MRKTSAVVAIVLAVGMAAALDAEARRLGGGRSSGMQRQGVTAPANSTAKPGAPAQQPSPVPGSAATATAPAAAAAAAPAKRSWMGPLAGIAAGLGIAALASHFGFGEALANMMTVALVAMLAMTAIGFLLRKRATAAQGGLAGGGRIDGFAREQPSQAQAYSAPLQAQGSMIGSRVGGGTGDTMPASRAVGQVPPGFDTAGFERIAREQFMALQAANDARDLPKLRDYLSPDMFEVVRAEIAGRGDAQQATEVFGLHAQVVNVTEEAGLHVVSVRFSGSIRERFGAEIEDLDEVWHLAKPNSGPGGWVIAGIQQGED
jgi:predicted lipid-binding transport protein (Tim44 family)